MTVLSAQSIRRRIESPVDDVDFGHFRAPTWDLTIEPYEPESLKAFGMSYGVTAAGYDIRAGKVGRYDHLQEEVAIFPGEMVLIASLEWVKIPHDLQVIAHDKSTWARRGLALQNTVLEPGWFGHITLELSNHGKEILHIKTGMPIAQLIFHQLDQPTDRPYTGKYQNQISDPVPAILVGESTNA